MTLLRKAILWRDLRFMEDPFAPRGANLQLLQFGTLDFGERFLA
jgi:hypothetical protein